MGKGNISHQNHYFARYHSEFIHKYFKVEIKEMLEFLIKAHNRCDRSAEDAYSS
jgi:hypothetical protein